MSKGLGSASLERTPGVHPSLKKLQIGATAPAVARNKMALVALFKCTGVQIVALVSDRALRRTWTGHVCFARSRSDHAHEGGSVSAARPPAPKALGRPTACRGGGAAVVRLLNSSPAMRRMTS